MALVLLCSYCWSMVWESAMNGQGTWNNMIGHCSDVLDACYGVVRL